MKQLNNSFKVLSLLVLAFAMVLFVSCDKEEPTAPDFRVAFSFSPESPKAGEEVTFTNASNGGTTFAWEFGDGGTSDEKNPAYTFGKAGTYSVVLTVDGNASNAATKDVTVGAPVPVISYLPAVVEKRAEITFSVAAYNPDQKAVTYAWDFGDSAEGAELTDGKSTAASPVVVFNSEAIVPVKISVTIDGSTFSATTNVDVKGQLAKTLLFSVVDLNESGSIYSKKLFDGFDEPATDLNVPTKSHPLTLKVANDRLYVFDAGVGIKYTTGEAAKPDGLIFSTGLADPSDYKTIMTFKDAPEGVTNYHDPFFGEVTSDKIYFTDRLYGVTSISVDTENAKYTIEDFPFFLKNGDLGYSSANRTDGGPTYGCCALNGTFKIRSNGEIWWAKNSTDKGLWRFTSDDIGKTNTVPALGGILTTESVRAFELDETNQKIYFSINKLSGTLDLGFYRANFDGSNIELIDGSRIDSEGGDNERTGITGIAVDAEGGYVYWGYRAPANADPENPLEVSSVKRWRIDGTGDVEIYVSDVWVYGLAIDQSKT